MSKNDVIWINPKIPQSELKIQAKALKSSILWDRQLNGLGIPEELLGLRAQTNWQRTVVSK